MALNDPGFFCDTEQLLELLRRLNGAVKPVFRGEQAVDLIRMPWDGDAAGVLGEVGELVAVAARRAGRRWNSKGKKWEAAR